MCKWAIDRLFGVPSNVSICLIINFLERLRRLGQFFWNFQSELRLGDIKGLNQVAVLHTPAIELYRIEKKINLVNIIKNCIIQQSSHCL